MSILLRLYSNIFIPLVLVALAVDFAIARTDKGLHFIQLPFEGLSNHTVNCIYQDETGFLWLGTINGLNRYDGYDYIVYQSNDNSKTGLSNNYINSINQDKDGNIWVATKYGLNVLKRGQNHFMTYLSDKTDPNSLQNTNIEIVYRDSKDRIWIGSWGGLSMYNYDIDNFTNYIHDPENENTISGDVVTSIMEDSKGRLWVGTSFSGLNLLDFSTNTFQRFQKDAKKKNCLSDNSISTIYEDEKGQIWVGVERGGLNRFEEGTQTFKWYHNEEKPNSLASNTVYSIIEDGNGDLMIGGMNGGISVYNSLEDNFSRFDTQGNYNPFGSKASVFSHYKLRSGEVVIATSNGGVKIQDNYPMSVELYRHNSENNRSLPINNVSAIIEDNKGNFWVGTSGGGLSYFNSSKKDFQPYPSFKGKTINSLFIDKRGQLWIGTLENGLARFNKSTHAFEYLKQVPDRSNSLNSDLVTTVIENRNGLWLGTGQGLDLLTAKTKSILHFTESTHRNQKIQIGKVNHMLVDYTYKLWVASESGLHYYDEQKGSFVYHKYLTSKKDQRHGWITYCYEDSNQYIWLSSLDGELVLLDVNRQPIELVLPNQNHEIKEVTNVLEDSNGFYWISCRQGLFKCEINLNTKVIKVVNSFDKNDGLQGNLFNTNTGVVSRKTGEMLIGGLSGLNIFHPDRMNPNPNPPPVVLTGFKVNGKPFHLEGHQQHNIKEVSLLHKEASTVDFYFSALNYIKPEKNQYTYKLEGYDDSWNYVGNKHMASYANLPAGNYNFKIRASNNDGVWNTQGTSMQIGIVPVLWETATFRVGLLALGLTTVVLGFIGYRRKKTTRPGFTTLIGLMGGNKNDGFIISKDSHDQTFVQLIIDYVESNIDNETLSIKTMCMELGISRALLFRKIKDLTGKTVSNFIKDIRLEKAKFYLDSNPSSVGEVAYAIGFKSHAHFSRSFKEKFGITPSTYVQSI